MSELYSADFSELYDTLKKNGLKISNQYLEKRIAELLDDEGRIKDYNKVLVKLILNDLILFDDAIPDIKKELQNFYELDTYVPNLNYKSNTKLVNILADNNKMEYERKLALKIGDNVTTFTTTYDKISLELYGGFSPEDRSNYDAVCSLWEAGNRIITTDQIYRHKNGYPSEKKKGDTIISVRASDVARDNIVTSLEKMRRMFVDIDFTDELKSYYKQKKGDASFKRIYEAFMVVENGEEKAVINKAVLEFDRVPLNNGGYAYNILRKPSLYEYSQISGQIISVPVSLLNLEDVMDRVNPEVSVIRDYLIRRIATMKKNSKMSNKITLDGIYNEIRIESPNKKKTQTVRNQVEKILTHFKQQGFVKEFQFYKHGRTIKGIDIYF